MALEIDYDELSERSGIPIEQLRETEKTTTTGNANGVLAEFDWMQLHHSVSLNGPTDIALTFVDYFSVDNKSRCVSDSNS